MINKKAVVKAKADIQKIKGIVSEMQMNVTNHGITIDTKLVTEEQLKIGLELQENELKHGVNIKFGQLEERIKVKIKKRLKIIDYKEYLKGKVGVDEFYKHI